MITSALVTRVLGECGAGWTRALALDLINEEQNSLLGDNNSLMRIKPDPYFVTADATYTYNARTATGSAFDPRHIEDIYTLNVNDDFSVLSALNSESTHPYRREQTRDGVTTHAAFTCADSIRPFTEASDSSYDASITWWLQNNPGTTTTTWRAEAYKWPTQLTAESVELSVPTDFRKLLLWGVLKNTERREYGRDDFTNEMYEALLAKFKARYRRMPIIGKVNHVHPEPC